MKKALLSLLVMVCAAATASAYDFKVGDFYYNHLDDGTVQLAKGDSLALTGQLNIPSEVTYEGTTYTVTQIGPDAFIHTSGITGIYLPASIKRLHNGGGGQPNPFTYCENVETIVVDPDNPTYDSRDNCNAIISKGGADAYAPANQMVAGCKNTTIPSSVNQLGSNVFAGCTGLTSINIPGTVQYLWGKTFLRCSNLAEVTLNEGLELISANTFAHCTSLKSINIPASVTRIQALAFAGCNALETITVESDNQKYDSRDNSNAIITKVAVTQSPAVAPKDQLVVGCKTTVIPSTVTSLGQYAFVQIATLENLDIPENVTSIGNYAFHSCTGLKSINEYAAQNTVTLGTAVWTNVDQANCKLHVYPDDYNYYSTTAQWKEFDVVGDLGQAPAEAMYIIGSFNGWNPETQLPLTLGEDGKWTITREMGEGVLFKFRDQDGNWYGGQDSNGVGYFEIKKDMVTGGTPITLVDGANFMIPVAGEWTFTVDKANMTVVVSGEWVDPLPEPKDVYILGEVNSNNWATNVGVKMDTEDHVTYTADVTCGNISDLDTDGVAYFSFTTKLAESPNDWDAIASSRFGAQSSDYEVTEAMLGTELTLQAGSNAFKLSDGEYNFNVNLETMKFVITKKAAGMRGDANGDGTVDVNDVTTTINYILSKNPNPFVYDNANVNGDATVDVMDVTLIINIILGVNQ